MNDWHFSQGRDTFTYNTNIWNDEILCTDEQNCYLEGCTVSDTIKNQMQGWSIFKTSGHHWQVKLARYHTIIWTNVGLLLIETSNIYQWNFNQKTNIFEVKKMHLKMQSPKWHQFCLSLNLLTHLGLGLLTHWGWDKTDAILQTTFSSAFFWTKMFELWL